MDVVKAIETYVNKMVATPLAMKVLLLDSHTVCTRQVPVVGADCYTTQ